MAANTVEATLLSRFEDGISRGIAQTEKLMGQAFSNISSASATLSSSVERAFASVLSYLGSFQDRLRQTAEQSNNEFTKMGAGAAAVGLVIVAALLKAGKAVSDFIFDLARQSSAALQAKVSFESLTAAAGVQADVYSGKLKQATQGLVSGTVLLQNANRVLQSGIPITSDQYAKLVDNVFRLSKAAGKDGADAINLLTDSLIRGSARGLQSVGVNVALKDAISEMQAAMGEGTAPLANRSKMQAYYNELLKQTSDGVAKLGPQFKTIDDLLRQSDLTWKGFISSVGQAVGRSKVLQEVMDQASNGMLKLGMNKDSLDALTRSTNAFVITTIRGFADLVEVLGVLYSAFIGLRGVLNLIGAVLIGSVAGALWVVFSAAQALLMLLGKLPGNVGAAFRQMVAEMDADTKRLGEMTRNAANSIGKGFEGFNTGREWMNSLADSSRKLAADMEKYVNEVVRGAGANDEHTRSLARSAAAQKELAEQTKKYEEIRSALANKQATPDQQALNELREEFRKIEELTQISEAKKNYLRLQAEAVYDAKINDLNEKRMEGIRKAADDIANEMKSESAVKEAIRQGDFVLEQLYHTREIEERRRVEERLTRATEEEAKKREDQRRKESNQIIASAHTLANAIEASLKRSISVDIGKQAMAQIPDLIEKIKRKIAELAQMKLLNPEQIAELIKLRETLDRLNSLKMGTFQGMIKQLKDDLLQMATTTTMAFEQFWSDIVSGQENAGKKFIAALLDMVANELMILAIRQVAAGYASWPNFAAMAGHFAAAAAITTLAGVLKGIGAAISSTSTTSTSADNGSSTSSSNATDSTQVVNAGAAKGTQNQGQVTQTSVVGEVHLVVEHSDDYVIRAVERNVTSNGRLRAVIRKA